MPWKPSSVCHIGIELDICLTSDSFINIASSPQCLQGYLCKKVNQWRVGIRCMASRRTHFSGEAI